MSTIAYDCKKKAHVRRCTGSRRRQRATAPSDGCRRRSTTSAAAATFRCEQNTIQTSQVTRWLNEQYDTTLCKSRIRGASAGVARVGVGNARGDSGLPLPLPLPLAALVVDGALATIVASLSSSTTALLFVRRAASTSSSSAAAAVVEAADAADARMSSIANDSSSCGGVVGCRKDNETICKNKASRKWKRKSNSSYRSVGHWKFLLQSRQRFVSNDRRRFCNRQRTNQATITRVERSETSIIDGISQTLSC